MTAVIPQGMRGICRLLAWQQPAGLVLLLLFICGTHTCMAQLPVCGLSFQSRVGNGTSVDGDGLDTLGRKLGSSSESSDAESIGSDLSDEEGKAAARSLRNMCVQNMMGDGWVGTVRRLHSSRCIYLRRKGESVVKAIGKKLHHVGDLSLEFEMMATNVDTVRDMMRDTV
eukprot:1150705-Pelagomonas_calceolata.AAC.1